MATTLILVVGVTLIVSALCSLLEATLYSTRIATIGSTWKLVTNFGLGTPAANHNPWIRSLSSTTAG